MAAAKSMTSKNDGTPVGISPASAIPPRSAPMLNTFATSTAAQAMYTNGRG
jgi:hypothetical protein